ncbi:MAG: ribosome assembly cofactor RimP [Bacteroidales bacterium]
MIHRETIEKLVTRYIEGTGLFVVDIHVSHTNDIRILVDNEKGVSIKECIDLSRAVESSLNRDKEDFRLEVSSPGLSEPLKVLPQYRKNIGRNIEVITKEGRKYEGKLNGLTGNGLIIEEKLKVKGDKKRPQTETVEKKIDFEEISSTKVLVSFN